MSVVASLAPRSNKNIHQFQTAEASSRVTVCVVTILQPTVKRHSRAPRTGAPSLPPATCVCRIFARDCFGSQAKFINDLLTLLGRHNHPSRIMAASRRQRMHLVTVVIFSIYLYLSMLYIDCTRQHHESLQQQTIDSSSSNT